MVQPESAEQYDEHFLRELYRQLRLIRVFEDRVEEMVLHGDLFTDAHLYQGQEAVAVGVCNALSENDLITSTHRPHGHVLAMGVDPNRVMAEIGGRESGVSGGRGGEMHMFEVDRGIIGSNGMVGASLPHAAGAAFAEKLDGNDSVVVSFFGDGAANQGVVHETMNLAAIWDLPVLFVCENNKYAVTASVDDMSTVDRLSERATGYGMPGTTIDGQDVLTVYEETTQAVDDIRRGNGPQWIECETYRYLDHTAAIGRLMGDVGYRSEEEQDSWRERDPIELFAETVTEAGVLTEATLDSVDEQVSQAVDDAVQFMRESEMPPAEDATEHTYQVDDYPNFPQPRYR